jgi:hypothetical protein
MAEYAAGARRDGAGWCQTSPTRYRAALGRRTGKTGCPEFRAVNHPVPNPSRIQMHAAYEILEAWI